MRILLHGINFPPELVGIGKFTGEMAAYLVEQGHQVRMVTAPPYYPDWHVWSGYHAWAYRRETVAGVEVYRSPLWVPAHPTGFTRLLHLASFAFFSAPVLMLQAFWSPDLVMCIAPAITAAPTAWLVARLAGCPAWLHIQDFEFDAAQGMAMLPGMSKSRSKTRFARGLSAAMAACERWLLKRFDHVSTISQRMLERLWLKGIPPEQASLLPNWVDCQAIYPLETSPSMPNPFRQEWGVTADQVLVLYAGSMGQKQGLELLVQAAQRLQDEPWIVFALCGEGSARQELQQQASRLTNILFAPLQPTERLNTLLNAADIHILLQRAQAADLVMPSKLTGMLSSGKPVIATANPGTELARVIEQVGLLVPAEDLDGLCAALRRLAEEPTLRHALGRQGRMYAEQNFDKRQILAQLNTSLLAVSHGPPPHPSS